MKTLDTWYIDGVRVTVLMVPEGWQASWKNRSGTIEFRVTDKKLDRLNFRVNQVIRGHHYR